MKNTPPPHIAQSAFARELEQVGFSANEAKVYVALLHLGHGTVSQITRNAGINRTTGYDVLESLVLKGLANISGKEPKQEYIAEPPERLEKYIQTQVKKWKHTLGGVQSLIPQLKSIHAVGDRPRVRFYEGKQGLIDVYEDTLTAKETIRAYATVDDMHKTLPHYFPAYYRRRARKGVRIRAIIPATDVGKERAARDKEEKRETALIPPEKYYFSPEINIYDNKTMIASWREKLGIIIESAEIADAMKKIFELAWSEAKQMRKKQ